MDSFGSTLELMRESESMNILDYSGTLNNSFDDSSSGYGSDDIDETSSSVTFTAKPKEQTHRKSVRDEVMLYTSTNSLLQGLECMITMPEMCDVTFLVGHQMTPIYGVKAIMMTRSRVLYQIILSCQKKALLKNKSKKSTYRPKVINGSLKIHIDGYDDVTFRRFNQFVHCGKVQLDVQSVVGLLCASSEFRMDDLKQACIDFINRLSTTRLSTTGRIPELEMTCADYSRHSRARKILEMINVQKKGTVV